MSLLCRVPVSLCLPPLGGPSLPHGFEVSKKLFHTLNAPDRRRPEGQRGPCRLHASMDNGESGSLGGIRRLMPNSRGSTSCGNSLASSVRENNRPIHLPGSSQCCPAAQAAETSSGVPGAAPRAQAQLSCLHRAQTAGLCLHSPEPCLGHTPQGPHQ